MKKNSILLGGVVIILLIVGGYYFFYGKENTKIDEKKLAREKLAEEIEQKLAAEPIEYFTEAETEKFASEKYQPLSFEEKDIEERIKKVKDQYQGILEEKRMFTSGQYLLVEPNAEEKIDLKIKWFSEPIIVYPEDMGITIKVINMNLRAENNYKPSQDFFYKDNRIYRVGKVTNPEYQNYELLVFRDFSLGADGLTFKAIYNPQTYSLIVFTNYSQNAFLYTTFYKIPAVLSNNYYISEFELKDQIVGKIDGKKYIFDLHVKELNKDNYVSWKYFNELKDVKENFFDSLYGPIYEVGDDGYFAIRIPDNTVGFYHLNMPFTFEYEYQEDSDMYAYDFISFKDMVFDDGYQYNQYSGFTPYKMNSCLSFQIQFY